MKYKVFYDGNYSSSVYIYDTDFDNGNQNNAEPKESITTYVRSLTIDHSWFDRSGYNVKKVIYNNKGNIYKSYYHKKLYYYDDNGNCECK